MFVEYRIESRTPIVLGGVQTYSSKRYHDIVRGEEIEVHRDGSVTLRVEGRIETFNNREVLELRAFN